MFKLSFCKVLMDRGKMFLSLCYATSVKVKCFQQIERQINSTISHHVNNTYLIIWDKGKPAKRSLLQSSGTGFKWR